METAKVGTNHRDLFAALAEPFAKSEISTRSGGGGRTLSYITARTVANRFDTVVGPENWRMRYRVETITGWGSAVICTIEVRIGGEWVGKEDAGGFKEMTEGPRGKSVRDEENTVKTGFSDALKRSACMWGVGRELYNDGVADFGPETTEGLPSQARPPHAREPEPTRKPAPARSRSAAPEVKDDDSEFTNADLIQWARDQEENTGLNVLGWLEKWGRSPKRKYPGFITKWSRAQLAAGYHAAAEKLAKLAAEDAEGNGPRREIYEEALSN